MLKLMILISQIELIFWSASNPNRADGDKNFGDENECRLELVLAIGQTIFGLVKLKPPGRICPTRFLSEFLFTVNPTVNSK